MSAIPRTLSGKKMELPVKKLLLGAAPEKVFKLDAMANAACVDWFVDLAAAPAAKPAIDPGQRDDCRRRHGARLARRLAPALDAAPASGCCGCRSAPTVPGCRRCSP